MKCFYHNDLDGNAAAYCVHVWVGIHDSINGQNEIPEFIEINYGTLFPFDKIRKNEQIWIVDYSIEPSEMLRLLEITKDITWIDHHKTAIEKYKDFPVRIRGIRQDGEAACVLAWKYIHWWTDRGEGEENFNKTNEKIPVAECIKLTGDRDIWAWKYGELTKYFFAGSQLHDTSPSSEFWWNCHKHEIELLPLPNTGNAAARKEGEEFWNRLIESGKIVEQYKKCSDKDINNSIGYETYFEGCKCWAINRARISSDRLGSRIERYDILLPYYHDGEQWIVSLYSAKVDVSVIAKKYGGGGHKGASGFQCRNLPFVKNK
ncbi:MAG: hypothetical protein WC389_10900 [Lutibacter sp.]|jgi:oligoribonuclease NrnB/cAMP/cGMP phosphodiesterase (DHH superfamily)